MCTIYNKLTNSVSANYERLIKILYLLKNISNWSVIVLEIHNMIQIICMFLLFFFYFQSHFV